MVTSVRIVENTALIWGLTYFPVPRFTFPHLEIRFSYKECSVESGRKQESSQTVRITTSVHQTSPHFSWWDAPTPRRLPRDDTVESGHLGSNPALLLVSGLTSLGFSFFLSVYEWRFV